MAVREISKRKRIKSKTIFATLSFICFVLMLGAVGAIETGAIPLSQGAIRSFLYLGLFAIFAGLGGAFKHDESM